MVSIYNIFINVCAECTSDVYFLYFPFHSKVIIQIMYSGMYIVEWIVKLYLKVSTLDTFMT